MIYKKLDRSLRLYPFSLKWTQMFLKTAPHHGWGAKKILNISTSKTAISAFLNQNSLLELG